MDKDILIEMTRKHIHKLREESPDVMQRDVKIALGKLFVELKEAQKHDKTILKKLFTLG